jgi:hypothetical protein
MDTPGPAHYNSAVYESQTKFKRSSSMFLSRTKRKGPAEINEVVPPIGSYEQNQNTIQ